MTLVCACVCVFVCVSVCVPDLDSLDTIDALLDCGLYGVHVFGRFVDSEVHEALLMCC